MRRASSARRRSSPFSTISVCDPPARSMVVRNCATDIPATRSISVSVILAPHSLRQLLDGGRGGAGGQVNGGGGRFI
jgi:hypothetical protein